MLPNLKTCPFPGPWAAGQPQHPLPDDYESHPLKYLPPKMALSDAELDLADRYDNRDLSGGYIPSLVAFTRRGPSAAANAIRRAKFQMLRAEVVRLGFVLPAAYVELVEADELLARLRHGCIWPMLPDVLARPVDGSEHLLFLIFGEGQGCGYWHLVLTPHHGHVVTFSEHPFGLSDGHPPGREPVPALSELHRCADSFAEWIVRFSIECVAQDRHHEIVLQKWFGG
jgi:hypothetical protein